MTTENSLIDAALRGWKSNAREASRRPAEFHQEVTFSDETKVWNVKDGVGTEKSLNGNVARTLDYCDAMNFASIAFPFGEFGLALQDSTLSLIYKGLETS